MAINRDFKGIWIPKEVWLSKDLTIMEKIFFVEIDSLDNEKGCFASNAYFADFFDISKGRCTQIIKQLESKGLITIELIRNGKQVVKRLIRVVNKLNNPIKNIKQPYLENDEDNNTVFNNTNIIVRTSTEIDAEYIATYLFNKILSNNPSFKGNCKVWEKDIEKCLRIDERRKEDLVNCIDWIYSAKGSFWIPNIMSGRKLRDKYDQLFMQMNSNKQNTYQDKKQGTKNAIKEAFQILEEQKDTVIDYE